MKRVIDFLWIVFVSPIEYMGRIGNGYHTYPKAYFLFELPCDRECDDLENKNKWRHVYKQRGQLEV